MTDFGQEGPTGHAGDEEDCGFEGHMATTQEETWGGFCWEVQVGKERGALSGRLRGGILDVSRVDCYHDFKLLFDTFHELLQPREQRAAHCRSPGSVQARPSGLQFQLVGSLYWK